MYLTPLQTSAFNKYTFKKTASDLRTLEIDDSLFTIDSRHQIVGIPRSAKDVPPLPLWLTKLEAPNLNANIVIDTRSYIKEDNTPAKQDVADFYLLGAKLINIWMGGGQGDIKDAGGDFLVKVYGQWTRNALTQRIGLDIDQVYLVQAVMVIFYLQQHEPITNNSSGSQIDRLLNRAARALPSTDPSILSERLNDIIKPLETLEDALNWIRELAETPRMESLTLALARTVIGRVWPMQYLAVSNAAVEYPPVFAAMVYHTLKSRNFIRSELGDLLKKTVRANEADNFVRSMDRLLSQ